MIDPRDPSSVLEREFLDRLQGARQGARVEARAQRDGVALDVLRHFYEGRAERASGKARGQRDEEVARGVEELDPALQSAEAETR